MKPQLSDSIFMTPFLTVYSYSLLTGQQIMSGWMSVLLER